MKGTLILISLMVMLIGCKVQEPITITNTKVEKEYIKITDTLVKTAPDSSSIAALLKCDSLGNVYLTQLNDVKGRVTSQTVSLKDNKIIVDCKVDSMAVFVKMSKAYKTSSDTTTVKPPPEYIEVEKPLTWWAKTLRICGYLWIGSILLVIGYVFLKLRPL